jgi:cytochrome c biogenesis protein CcdA
MHRRRASHVMNAYSSSRYVNDKNEDFSNLDHVAQNENSLTYVKGYLLLAFTIVFFVFGVYLTVISKFMPETGNLLLDFIKRVCILFITL